LPVTVRIYIPGYVPTTRNQLKGVHWSAEYREKKRAAHALKSALESDFSFTALDQPIGTTIPRNNCKIALSRLVSWMQTTGIDSAGKSSLTRFTRKKKKQRSLK